MINIDISENSLIPLISLKLESFQSLDQLELKLLLKLLLLRVASLLEALAVLKKFKNYQILLVC